MRIELNAGGLGGISIASCQANLNKFSSSAQSVCNGFNTVQKALNNVTGGMNGTLQTVSGYVGQRIKQESQKIQNVAETTKQTVAFLNETISTDKKVAGIVDKNNDDFYRISPHLKPNSSVPDGLVESIFDLLENDHGVFRGVVSFYEKVSELIRNCLEKIEEKVFVPYAVESMKKLIDSTFNGSVAVVMLQVEDELSELDDLMQWIDDGFCGTLDENQRYWLKETAKLLWKNGVKVYDIVDKFRNGNIMDAITDIMSAGATVFDVKSMSFNPIGAKLEALSIILDLIFAEDSYLIKNSEKYEEKMLEDLKHGDILGLVWDLSGSFVQTVGKGTVDTTCKLIGELFNDLTGGYYKKLDEWINHEYGYSLNHLLKDLGKSISDDVDFLIDAVSEGFDYIADISWKGIKGAWNGIKKAGGAICGWVSSWF